jgi:Ni/Fe-hydrogenase subunit HybB-like protein
MTFDPLQYFSWRVSVAVVVFYTGLEFGGEVLRNDIFSKRNARPLSAIFAIHLAFLLVLLGLMRLAVAVSPSLPNWLTDTIGLRGTSVIDTLYIVAVFFIHRTEQRCIFAERNTDHAAGSENSSSQ